jgi:hypothetical protein
LRQRTRHHRRLAEVAVLSNRRGGGGHRAIAAADSTMRAIDQRRDLEPINDPGVLQ